MSGVSSIVYRCSPTVSWVKDSHRTILIEKENGRSWSLQGFEAAVWDLLVLRYPAVQIIEFLAVLLGEPVEKATEVLGSLLQEWRETGIVKAVEKTQGGESGDQCSL
ncbi:MAG: hypothetical protein ACUVWZ_05095 [Anaerolineae bacterium]